MLLRLFTPSCQLSLMYVEVVVTEEAINLKALLAGKHCSVVILPEIEPPTSSICAVFPVKSQVKVTSFPVLNCPDLIFNQGTDFSI